ncbi:hypothetical protein AB1Y20_007356 [Prymnesium parvum]|uniref:Phospholipase B-like n=1 Tax=Prymnesium parvum TaxID=97485 RepID=A0AB34IWX7_PRYPA
MPRQRRSPLAFATALLLVSCANAAAPIGSAALALEGGGFRAQSADTGVLAGLLAFVGKQRGIAAPTFESTGLLDRFPTVSTNSGSSWFFSSLVYSPRFKSLLEAMAARPTQSAAIYKAGYTNSWLAATNVDSTHFNLWEKAARAIAALLGTGDEDSIYIITYFLATGFDWGHFVDVLLNSTATLSRNATLGMTPTGSWAKGKVWISCHSVITPGTDGHESKLYQGVLGYPRVTYTTQSSSASFPDYVPAAFSVRLGDGLTSFAPYRYVAPSAVATLQSFEYRGVVVPIVDEHKASYGQAGAILSGDTFRTNVGMQPIARVVSASSAFMGCAALFGPLASELQALISGDVTPWISSSADGRSFDNADALVQALKSGVSQGAVNALASTGVHGVIDGGYTDNSGVANALVAGATEITVVLNSGAAESLSYLFQGGPPGGSPFQPKSLFPVFATPNASAANVAFSAFESFALPLPTRWLKKFSVGTLKATTAKNAAWGLEAGRNVSLHIVSLSSSLDIGEFENLAHYDQLAEELILTILSEQNKPLVQSTLLPMFLGRSAVQLRN